MGRVHFNLANSAQLGGMAPAPLAGGGFAPAALPAGMAGAGVYIILNANVVPHNRYIGIAGAPGGIHGRFAHRLPTITEMGFDVATMNNIGVTWGTVAFQNSPPLVEAQAAAAAAAAAQMMINAGGAVGVPMAGAIAFMAAHGAAVSAGLGAVPATIVAQAAHGGLPPMGLGFVPPPLYAPPPPPTPAQLLAAAAAPAALRPVVVAAAVATGCPIANVANLVNAIGALPGGAAAAVAQTALDRASIVPWGVPVAAVPAPPAAFQAPVDGVMVNFERLLIRFVIDQLLGPAAPPGTVSNNTYAGAAYANPTNRAMAVTLTWGALPGGYAAGNLTRVWRPGVANAW